MKGWLRFIPVHLIKTHKRKNMEIKGKVLTLFPVKEGVGKTSGTPWKSREFVIETQDQYPKRICLQVMNANMDRFPMEEGMEVSVKFDISARERDAVTSTR